MICPVCGKEAVKVYSDYMANILMEEEYKCGDHYDYQYVTGYSREFIGKYEVILSCQKNVGLHEQIYRSVAILLTQLRLKFSHVK